MIPSCVSESIGAGNRSRVRHTCSYLEIYRQEDMHPLSLNVWDEYYFAIMLCIVPSPIFSIFRGFDTGYGSQIRRTPNKDKSENIKKLGPKYFNRF